ncbi:MAG: hypothetical protein IH589_09460 [Anaerolineales bacterium]|nr:hypothetical protein [Anaerolineales bacterium]
MEKQIGLWIDHKQAAIVILEGEKEEIRKIESNMEKYVRYKGGAHGKTAYSPQFLSTETQEDRRFREHLNKYYQQVISIIDGADSLMIIGAGEAKHEFEKRLQHEGKRIRTIYMETADKMTERQLAAKVRKYFEK